MMDKSKFDVGDHARTLSGSAFWPVVFVGKNERGEWFVGLQMPWGPTLYPQTEWTKEPSRRRSPAEPYYSHANPASAMFGGRSGVGFGDVKFTIDLGGLKYDSDKPGYELIPPEALEAIADTLTYGAKKYAPRNWEKGIKAGRLFGAIMRHLWAFWRGEDNDPESGKPHLNHALTTLCMLQTLMLRRPDLDDRPKEPKQ